jgi:transcriptional regulator GlxA family with amidase domain
MSVINVALSCGFESSSHFSKSYRLKYTVSPFDERRARR